MRFYFKYHCYIDLFGGLYTFSSGSGKWKWSYWSLECIWNL